MTDLDESLYEHDTLRSTLAVRICALRDKPVSADVFGAMFSDSDANLYAVVGNEQAAQLVREIAPGAIVTIID